MAKKTEAEASAQAEQTPEIPAAPRPPQGIVLRPSRTGDPRKDFITRYKKPRIDPACLVVDGQAPYLALPILSSDEVRIRQVDPDTASALLSCDVATGGQSIYRLATDAEVEAFKAEAAKRAKK